MNDATAVRLAEIDVAKATLTRDYRKKVSDTLAELAGSGSSSNADADRAMYETQMAEQELLAALVLLQAARAK